MSGTPYQPVFNASHSNLHAQNRYEDVRDTQFFTPETEPLELHQDELPAGAAPPRFMGAARNDAGNRASFASSQASVPTMVGDDYEGSTDGLNQKGRGFYGLNYDDSEYNASQPAFDGRKSHPTTSPYLNEKRSPYTPRPRSRRKAIIIGSLVALAVIIAAVALGVYFAVIKPKHNDDTTSGNTASGASADGSSDNSGSNSGSTSSRVVISGGDGSTVTMFDGSTFTYTNKFGGTWYYDPANPTTSGARPQSWTPALNETFKFGEDPIRGVNLGGWLVTEPFIVPALYEKYVNTSDPAVDEWHLTQKLQADGAISDLEDHYKTFVTEQDFAEIAAAGLNFVRIPIPYWAIEVRENEPFLPKTQWTYFLKAVQWARKYGLRINLDLHSLPGSQNGWNHSGRLGDINVLLGPMGIANAQRSLDYIRIIAEFISQPEYKDVIPLFGITNEPFGPTVGQDAIQRYYIGNSTVTGRPPSPAWSYQLGLQEGWMPTDPRDSEGVCENTDPFNPPLQAWMTGGAGAGQIPATAQAALAWPPSTLTDAADIATLPQYTQTGTLVSLPAPTLTASAASTTSVLATGSWNNPSDSASMWVPIATCGYLDPWMGPDASTPACPPLSATARRRAEYAPRGGITPAPAPSS
ncbi:glycoside hydrolase family 5 protein [Trametes sanguinea]|nr:glycoside hydrolase family 5 protein [Trametes sanguinea]